MVSYACLQGRANRIARSPLGLRESEAAIECEAANVPQSLVAEHLILSSPSPWKTLADWVIHFALAASKSTELVIAMCHATIHGATQR